MRPPQKQQQQQQQFLAFTSPLLPPCRGSLCLPLRLHNQYAFLSVHRCPTSADTHLRKCQIFVRIYLHQQWQIRSINTQRSSENCTTKQTCMKSYQNVVWVKVGLGMRGSRETPPFNIRLICFGICTGSHCALCLLPIPIEHFSIFENNIFQLSFSKNPFAKSNT